MLRSHLKEWDKRIDFLTQFIHVTNLSRDFEKIKIYNYILILKR